MSCTFTPSRALAGLAALGLSSAALAEAERRVPITWTLPEPCATGPVSRERYGSEELQEVRIRVVEAGGAWEARLEAHYQLEVRQRTVRAESCAAAAGAGELLLTLLLEEQVGSPETEPSKPAEVAPPLETTAPLLEPPPELDLTPLPATSNRPEPVPRPTVPRRASKAKGLGGPPPSPRALPELNGWWAQLGPSFTWNRGSGESLGGSLGGGVDWDRWSVGLNAFFQQPLQAIELPENGTGTVTWWSLGLRASGCYLPAWNTAARTGSWNTRLGPCLGTSLARVSASTHGISDERSDQKWVPGVVGSIVGRAERAGLGFWLEASVRLDMGAITLDVVPHGEVARFSELSPGAAGGVRVSF